MDSKEAAPAWWTTGDFPLLPESPSSRIPETYTPCNSLPLCRSRVLKLHFRSALCYLVLQARCLSLCGGVAEIAVSLKHSFLP